MTLPAVLPEDQYQELAQELDAAYTEYSFQEREIRVEAMHTLGGIIRRFTSDAQITPLLQQLAQDLNKSERQLWYCVQAYDLDPDYNSFRNRLPDGKAATVSSVKKLISGKEEEEATAQEFSAPDEAAKIVKKHGMQRARDIADAIWGQVGEPE